MLAADMKVSYCDPGVEEYLDLKKKNGQME